MISLILATFFQARSTPISIIMTPCHPALQAGASLSEYWTRSRHGRPLSIGRLFRPLRHPHPAWRDHALASAAQQSAAGPVEHCPVGLCRALQRKNPRAPLPRDESSALREEEFIGGMAIITGHAAVAGTPCEGKFTDKFGQIHYLLLEPEKEKNLKRRQGADCLPTFRNALFG